MDFSGQTVLITGASRGIGAAAAEHFATLGAQVVLTARSEAELAKLAEKIGSKSLAIACDIADFAQVQAAVDQTVARFGRLDIVVNNAGMLLPVHRMADFEAADWDRVIDVNLKSVFLTTQYALPKLKQSPAGRIINISSVNGEKGQAGQTNYSAAKAGMHGFSMALAQELATKGVTVNTVSPGYIGTDMVKAIRPDVLEKIVATVPVKRLGEPSEIASIIAWLASEEGGYATGADFSVNGGLHMG